MANTATRLLVDLPGGETGKVLARQLPTLQAPVQARVIEALAARGDAGTRPVVLTLTKSADENVRLAALRALGVLGDASDVGLLSQLAATDKTAVGQAARESLDRLPGDAANTTMVAMFKGATPEVRAELARSLAARRASNAAAAMLASAETGSEAERIEAIKALGVLGEENVVPNLVRLLARSPNDAQRTATQNSLKDILDNRTQNKTAAGDALVAGLNGANPATRRALFALMRSVGGENTLTAVRAATRDADADIQDAAVRTLAQWPEAGAASALSEFATTTPKLNFHVLALGGVVRLSALPAFSTDERVKMLQNVLTVAKRPEEKRAALGALGKVVDADALAVVRPLLDNADLREEAALAAVNIGKSMGGDDVKATMQRVVEVSKNADTIKAATDVLNRPALASRSWQIIGPFPNVDGAGFDKDFGLERAVDLNKAYTTEGKNTARFRPVVPDANTGYVNLLEQFEQKENVVAYAVAYVKSPTARAAQLTGGSDDGVKIWVNGKRVVSNNAARAANPNDERADAQLKEGWNEVLVKVTQGGGDWGFFLDLLTPDKQPMTDLVWATKPN
jgi:HEAT repeat protein